MNYNQIAILFLQGTLVAFVILFLFRLRKKLGIGILLACLSLFQFVQIFLTSTVYISITENIIVSPGSTVFFTATLFALLITYIKEGASETKKIIYALFTVNIILVILLQTYSWHVNETSIQNPFNASIDFINHSSWTIMVGTALLYLDSLLIIILFEYISKKTHFLFLKICLTMLVVMCFDTVFFSTIAFWGLEKLDTIIISGLISKGVFIVFYSLLFYIYLKYFNSKNEVFQFYKTKDIFESLTFKQKFESAAERLEENTKMYRIVTDHSNDLILLQEPDSTFRYISPSIKKILGYEQSTFIGKKVFNLVHKDDLPSLKNALVQKVFVKGSNIDALPFRILHKKGHYIWLEFLSSPVYKGEEITYFVTSARDITQRVIANKKIQNSLELLEKSENSLKEASKVAKIGYQEYDIATNVYTWSDYVYDIYGIERKGKVPSFKDIISIFDEKSQKKIQKAALDLTSKGIPCDIELRCINLKKEEFWLRYVAKAEYNEQNEITGRNGVIQNITEWKNSKTELELSKQKIQTSLELLEKSEYSKNEASKIAKIGYLEYCTLTEKIVWSDYVYHIFGVDPKNGIPTKEEILSTFNEESKKRLIQVARDLLTNGTPYDVELKCVNLKNEEIWVRNVAQPIYNEQNEIICKIGVIQNITDSKIAQIELDLQNEKLNELNNTLNQAQKLSHIGSWIFNTVNKKSKWSEETFRIWGLDPKKGSPDFDTILNQIHKDDLELHNTSVKKAISLGTSFDIEFRIFLPNGEQKTLRGICESVFGDNGEVITLKGTNQDITEQTLIRNKIDEVEKMYRMLTDHSNDLICLHEQDSTFKYISPSIKNLLGYEQSELLGKKVFDIVHQHDIPSLKDMMLQKVKSGIFSETFSCRVLHKEGYFIWLEFASSPIYEDNKISSFVSSARDVTEWMLAKEKINEYQTSLQKLTTEITLIEEKQKKNIALNIHDHLSQSLVISKMKINELKKNPTLKIIGEDLKFIETHISEALENSRKITYELSPPVLYQLGLIEALNWLIDNIEVTHKIECQLHSNVNYIKLNDVKSILLYRSIQEVLTNAIKYANASLITIDIDKGKLGLDIFITDNGVGFDTSILNNYQNQTGSGFGLFTIQERIRNIQGKIKINSKINVGTSIIFFIPLSE